MVLLYLRVNVCACVCVCTDSNAQASSLMFECYCYETFETSEQEETFVLEAIPNSPMVIIVCSLQCQEKERRRKSRHREHFCFMHCNTQVVSHSR